MFKFIFSFILSCLLSPIAQASAPEKVDYELTLFTGYRTSDSFDYEHSDDDSTKHSIDVLDDASLGLVLAWEYDYGHQGQILFSHSNSEFDDDMLLNDYQLSISFLHFGGNINVGDGKVPILLSAGLGATHFKPEDDSLDSETKVSGHLGLGARFYIIENIALSLDARLYATVLDSDGSLFCNGERCDIKTTSDLWLQGEFSAGLVFKF